MARDNRPNPDGLRTPMESPLQLSKSEEVDLIDNCLELCGATDKDLPFRNCETQIRRAVYGLHERVCEELSPEGIQVLRLLAGHPYGICNLQALEESAASLHFTDTQVSLGLAELMRLGLVRSSLTEELGEGKLSVLYPPLRLAQRSKDSDRTVFKLLVEECLADYDTHWASA